MEKTVASGTKPFWIGGVGGSEFRFMNDQKAKKGDKTICSKKFASEKAIGQTRVYTYSSVGRCKFVENN